LNLRPLGYEPSELPNCSTPRRLSASSSALPLYRDDRVGFKPAVYAQWSRQVRPPSLRGLDRLDHPYAHSLDRLDHPR
jgi:hypothetical protein